MLTLSFVTEGIPLIHNGQEVGNQNQLEFFERDSIEWGDYIHSDGALIKRLITIKKTNPALHNGAAGGRIIPVSTDQPGEVLSFARQKDGNHVLVLFNLSATPVTFELTDGPVAGDWTEALTDTSENLQLGAQRTLAPWQGLVLTRQD